MSRQILIDVDPFLTRIAVMERDRLADIAFLDPNAPTLVGRIFLARITAVRKDIDACFVDLGLSGQQGFLQLKDIPSEFRETLFEGMKLPVQVLKDGTGEKGVQVSAFLQFEGRYGVFKPFGSGIVFAKSIKDAAVRAEISSCLSGLGAGTSAGGVVVRSAAASVPIDTLSGEMQALISRWQSLQQTIAQDKAVRDLTDLSPLSMMVSGLVTEHDTILVNDADALHALKAELGHSGIRAEQIGLAPVAEDLFEQFGAEEECDLLDRKRVALPSGGDITLEETEAMVVADVNSGGLVAAKGGRSVALQTNLDAAEVLLRQLRLRHLSGIVIVDFIRMEARGETDILTRRLRELAARDPASLRVVGMTELGLMQLVRRRTSRPVSQVLAMPLNTGVGHFPLGEASRLARAVRAFSRQAKKPVIAVAGGGAVRRFLENYGPRLEKALGVRLEYQLDDTLGERDYTLS
ncbi:ribonuclease E/G [Sneathiella chinensis]|uniref:Ribonuclease n=1 Tax=Sneathiella chinensis TaxID=349750 RepID=A0ABQ5U092_9PROT|nr:ribonuclease E/G [Sneathiella chinensis]GLQ05569.1 ribonuclease [Sneathiella chinensis]